MRSFREEWNDIVCHHNSKQHQEDIKRAKQKLLEKPFVFYGAGIEGILFAKILVFAEIKPLCFVDKNKAGVEEQTGIPIILPTALLNEFVDTNIIISSTMYRTEIEYDLQQMGVNADRILPRQLILLLLILCLGEAEKPDILKHHHYLFMYNSLNKVAKNKNAPMLLGCEQTYNWFADVRSKKVFIDYLRLCFITQPVAPCPIITQYFDPVVNLSDREVFVDCGAYTGDTAEIFMRNTNNKYAHYYAFEPDGEHFKEAEKFLMNKQNTTLTKKGLFSTETILNFKDGYTSCSKICDTGEAVVKVTSIDKYFSDKPHIPTFIKMDIEGAELEALEGAEFIIRKHKPKLAICVYHRPEDLYEIPEIIKSYREDYKLYLRHYTDTYSELVLYAV